MHVASLIARLSANPTAHEVAFERGSTLRDSLLVNEHVGIDLWSKCYQVTGPYKVSASAAKAAVASGTDPARVKHVLGVEKRTSVLSSLLRDAYPAQELFDDAGFLAALADEKIAEKMAKNFGPTLDAEALARLDATSLGGPLRVWRLTADSLTDEHVLAELLTFDTWGSPYLQKPIAWVLHTRPGVVRSLIGRTLPIAVLTQLAGSPNLGLLTAEEQTHTLRLTTEPSVDLADQLLYAWMAASSNPTLSMDVLDLLESRMAVSKREWNPTSTAVNRRNRRPWSVSSLTEEIPSDHMSELLAWAVPSRGKVRLAALDQLLTNPAFTVDEAAVVAGRLTDELQVAADDTALLAGGPGRIVLTRFAEKFPDQTDGLLARHTQRRDAIMRVNGVPFQQTVRQVDPTRPMGWSPAPEQVAWLDQRLASDAEAWSMVYQMADTLTSESLETFATTCVALTL